MVAVGEEAGGCGRGRAAKLSKTLVDGVETGRGLREEAGMAAEEKRGGLTDGWTHRICTCARAAAARSRSREVRGVTVPGERLRVEFGNPALVLYCAWQF